jgi:hypothetical protein
VDLTRGLKDRHGPVHAGSFLRQRRIALSCGAPELSRILVHEVFHFVWLRLGNPLRNEWQAVLRRELTAGVRGEMGWSAEWRKQKLQPHDVAARSRRWREYCCESFCDTAAWIYAGGAHPEFTLARRGCAWRHTWFTRAISARRLSV